MMGDAEPEGIPSSLSIDLYCGAKTKRTNYLSAALKGSMFMAVHLTILDFFMGSWRRLLLTSRNIQRPQRSKATYRSVDKIRVNH